MKKIILSIVGLLPIAAFAQTGFTINGTVGKLNAPAKAYLSYRNGKTAVSDSSNIVNGAFSFKGTVPTPLAASIRIKHDAAPVNPDPKLRKPNDVLSFYIENKTIMIASADSVKKATIKGSKVNDDNAKIKALRKPHQDKIDVLMAEYTKYTPEQQKDTTFMKGFMSRYQATSKEVSAALEPINKKFVEDNRDSFIGLQTYRSIMGYDIDPKVVEPEYMKFSADVRNSDLGKNIEMMIAGAKKTQIGMTTDFTQNDPDGKPVKLSDFKGKYVLVDFWASWCGPCRAENPNVVLAYNKYKEKNFTVLGVSLDQPGQKDAWLKAVEADKLTWTHVSDLQFWDNAVSKSYGIQAIPFNFLVDPNGKIVARNIRGEELQTKLAEILGPGSSK